MATPGDAADVDVGAAGAVEELEVEVEGLVVAGQAGRQRPAHLRRSSRASSRSAPVALRTASPGSGGTKTSGSNRVASTWAASLTSAGSTPVGDEEHVAVEAGALVAGPHLRHDAGDAQPLAVGQHAVDHHDVVELQVGAVAHPDPELRAAWRPRCR